MLRIYINNAVNFKMYSFVKHTIKFNNLYKLLIINLLY
jgi:hypothetical protein